MVSVPCRITKPSVRGVVLHNDVAGWRIQSHGRMLVLSMFMGCTTSSLQRPSISGTQAANSSPVRAGGEAVSGFGRGDGAASCNEENVLHKDSLWLIGI